MDIAGERAGHPLIVAVDDEPATLRLLTQSLRLYGLWCVTALDAQQGLPLIRALKPQLILLDVALPDLSGYELCRLIKEDPALAGTPVTILTAMNHAASDPAVVASGADAFLTKPFSPRELAGHVRALLQLNEPRRSMLWRGLSPDAPAA